MRAMSASDRRHLEALLSEFVAAHRGLRMGRLFGRPAAYAGRRVFAQIVDGGVAVKLPRAAEEAAVRVGLARSAPRVRRQAGWTTLAAAQPATVAKLGSFLEIAARHAAETGMTVSVEECR